MIDNKLKKDYVYIMYILYPITLLKLIEIFRWWHLKSILTD